MPDKGSGRSGGPGRLSGCRGVSFAREFAVCGVEAGVEGDYGCSGFVLAGVRRPAKNKTYVLEVGGSSGQVAFFLPAPLTL